MNRQRRQQIKKVEAALETLRKRVASLHEDEYQYQEGMFRRGVAESVDAADVDENLARLSNAESAIQRAIISLRRARE